MEMESDDRVAWLKDNKNAKSFCESLGPGLTIKHRLYSILASTALDPDNADHINEIVETNDISENRIASM